MTYEGYSDYMTKFVESMRLKKSVNNENDTDKIKEDK